MEPCRFLRASLDSKEEYLRIFTHQLLLYTSVTSRHRFPSTVNNNVHIRASEPSNMLQTILGSE